MRHAWLALALLAVPVRGTCGPITYTLRDARFFGGAPGQARELITSAALTPATDQTQATTYSTGGGTPVVFTAAATAQGSPFELRASNSVVAQSSTGLQFNISPFDPTNLATLVQSRVQENGVFVTGATGTGHLLPHFAVEGTFVDDHASAFGQLSICAGLGSCVLTGLGNSTGGVQQVTTTFTPLIGPQTAFTFDTPFSLFFFLGSGVSSTAVGTLAPGSVSGDFRLRLLGFSVVDGNGVPIDGAVVHSDLDNVPEPVTAGLVLLGLAAVTRRRRR